MEDIAVDYTVEFNTTVIDPVALGLTLVMCLAILILPRRYALVPIIVTTCFMPVGQRISVAGADFTMLRILIVFAWTRILLRERFRGFKLITLDYWMFAWVVVGTVAYVAQHRGALGALIWRIGWTLDTLGVYLFARGVLRTPRDLRVAIYAFAAVAVPTAILMGIEKATMRNFLSVFGGVPDITMVRKGSIRAQGAFSHPILAGSFGATLFPMLLGMILQKQSSRLWLFPPLVASVLIVVFSSSSGPIISLAAAGMGWGLWLLRGRIRVINLSLVSLLVFIQLLMRRPIWHLFSRVNIVGGSTGYHRFHLIQKAVEHLPEWALVGTPSTGHWGFNLFDVTNQYLLEGVRGGLGAMGIFIGVVTSSFRNVGRAVQRLGRAKTLPAGARRDGQLLFWGLGVSLLAHNVSFFGVSYWGQIQVLFMLGLAFSGFAEEGTRQLKRSRPGRTRAARGAADREDAQAPVAQPG